MSRIDWSQVPLGERTDADLARELGCHTTSVRYQRRRRGIPSCAEARRQRAIEEGCRVHMGRPVAQADLCESCCARVASAVAARPHRWPHLRERHTLLRMGRPSQEMRALWPGIVEARQAAKEADEALATSRMTEPQAAAWCKTATATDALQVIAEMEPRQHVSRTASARLEELAETATTRRAA